MVNRIWQHHFGVGLVASPNDFGARGKLPTNPELLDYLASRFVEGGWSIKALHRLLLGSAAYARCAADGVGGVLQVRLDAPVADRAAAHVGVHDVADVLEQRLEPLVGAQRVRNYIKTLNMELTMIARACGKQDVHHLEREDLAALTLEAAAMARIPLAGTSWIPGT